MNHNHQEPFKIHVGGVSSTFEVPIHHNASEAPVPEHSRRGRLGGWAMDVIERHWPDAHHKIGEDVAAIQGAREAGYGVTGIPDIDHAPTKRRREITVTDSSVSAESVSVGHLASH